MVEAWKRRFLDRDSEGERARSKKLDNVGERNNIPNGEQTLPSKICCNNLGGVTQEHRIRPLPFQKLILDIHTLCPLYNPGVATCRTLERCSSGSGESSGIMQRFRVVGGRGSR